MKLPGGVTAIIVGCQLAVAIALVAFGVAVTQRMTSVERLWSEYNREATSASHHMYEIDRSIGYGGFIHELKNYVLRQDPRLLEKIDADIGRLEAGIQGYRAGNPSRGEALALGQLQGVLAQYKQNRLVAERMVGEGRTPREIDAVVKVDDRPALDAIEFLSGRTPARHRAHKRETGLAIRETVSFLMWGLLLIPLIMVVGVVLITIVKRLTEANWHLDQARANLDRLVEDAPDTLLIVTPDGHIRRANARASELFGYSAEEFPGMDITRLIPAQFRDRHRELVEGYVHSPTARPMGRNRGIFALHKSGREFPVDISLSHYVEGGKRYGMATLRDMTERMAAEAEIVAAKEAAEKASQAKTEFLSTMSHDLRTPLSAILGFAQLLLADNSDLAPAQREDANEIYKAAEHLARIIDELLELSKIEAGQLSLTLETLNAAEAILDSIDLIAPLAEKRRVSISFTCCGQHLPQQERAATSCLVLADRTRLRQIMLNLLSNAIKYNKEGGEIFVDARTFDSGRCRISVRDTGIGIGSEKHSGLFSMFDRLGAEHSGIEGTGIGLYFTKKLVERMGGEITVESELGKGSTFRVELPAPGPEAVEAETARIEPPPDSPPVAVEASVLYIEQDPGEIALVERLLRPYPAIRLLSAPHPGLGLELAEAHQPRLILVNFDSPDTDFVQFRKQINENPMLKNTFVFAVTADRQAASGAIATSGEFDGVLTKPLDVTRFAEVVAHITGD